MLELLIEFGVGGSPSVHDGQEEGDCRKSGEDGEPDEDSHGTDRVRCQQVQSGSVGVAAQLVFIVMFISLIDRTW